MSGFLRGFGLFLLPLCGWLAGDAVQSETTLHLAVLQRTIELLQRIRQEIADGHYREAILQINRRMYRMLSVRELLIGRRIRDDRCYRRALRRFSAFREAAVDVDQYMVLVRQAYFSDDEMRAEDAWTVYKIYQRCRMERKERLTKANGTDIFRIDI